MRLCRHGHLIVLGMPCRPCAYRRQREWRARARTPQPAAPVSLVMCGRGHVLASVGDVRVFAGRVACGRCVDDANAERASLRT